MLVLGIQRLVRHVAMPQRFGTVDPTTPVATKLVGSMALSVMTIQRANCVAIKRTIYYSVVVLVGPMAPCVRQVKPAIYVATTQRIGMVSNLGDVAQKRVGHRKLDVIREVHAMLVAMVLHGSWHVFGRVAILCSSYLFLL